MNEQPRDEEQPEGEVVSKATHAFFFLCAATCVSFLAWSAIGTLDIVSVAQGEVIPSTQVKSIQHLEGGIVLEIMAREGQRVAQGQALVTLEPTTSGADVGELQVRLSSLRAEIARLEAEAEGKPAPEFDADLKAARPDLVAQVQERFDVRRRGNLSKITSQKEMMLQRKHEIEAITARIKTSEDQLKLQREQIKISEDLLKSDLTNRYNHLDLLKKSTELTGGIEQDKASVLRANASLKEAESTLQSIISSYQEEVGKELKETRVSFQELSQRIEKYKDSLKRTVVRSPVDGFIKTLYVVTIGGVVKPGGPIADVVPGEDRLVIEAKLPTQDIGYVEAGQAAKVKLASADATRFGALDGTVLSISPDALVTQDGMPYYKVRIETSADHFAQKNLKYFLFPGMQVMASIETGKRTVLEYLTDPMRGYVGDAMRER
jgi:adhesin transport system membrane fusion protein